MNHRPILFDDWDEQLKMARENDETWAFFIRRLRASDYLVPRQPDGKGFSLLASQKDALFLPAFTSESEFGKWMAPCGGASFLPFDMLHHIVVDDSRLSGVVVNPFRSALILRRDQLTAMENAATGMTHERVEHTGRLILEQARYAPALGRAFVKALTKSPMEIFEAYILTARQAHEKTSHLLFLIDFNGDRKRLFPAVAQAMQPYMKPGTNFELLKANLTLLNAARKIAAPVYGAKDKTR
jgi:hypothetical protein